MGGGGRRVQCGKSKRNYMTWQWGRRDSNTSRLRGYCADSHLRVLPESMWQWSLPLVINKGQIRHCSWCGGRESLCCLLSAKRR
eukprot:6158085-Amphidinium_carterae.1